MIVTMMDAVLGLVRAECQVAALTQRWRIERYNSENKQKHRRRETRRESHDIILEKYAMLCKLSCVDILSSGGHSPLRSTPLHTLHYPPFEIIQMLTIDVLAISY